MKIHLFLINFFLTVALSSLQAQVFPYLNASTGNEGQYIVDADTNIFMYHGNQLEKYDKNFNPIWVKTYNGLVFQNILLSKTGSLYFICGNNSRDVIGKMKNDGTIDWCKHINNLDINNYSGTYTSQDCSFYKLILDRNNNLVISGIVQAVSNSYEKACLFLKMDTTGVVINFKSFFEFGVGYGKFTVLDDSLGVYRFIWDGYYFENSGAGLFSYDEINDTIINQVGFTGFPQFSYNKGSVFFKSKLNQDYFYSITQWITNQDPYYKNFLITKFHKNNAVWSKQTTMGGAFDYNINSVDEDENKNLLFTISPFNWTYNFTNTCFILDSTSGTINSKLLLAYPWNLQNQNHRVSPKLNVLYGKKYFYDIYGGNFSNNPLNLTQLDSSLNTLCSNTLTAVTQSIGFESGSYLSTIIISNLASYTMVDSIISTNAVSNFSLTTNYCLVLNNTEAAISNDVITVYPNPAEHILKIKLPNDMFIKELTVFDVNGRKILFDSKIDVDISELNTGIYFIKVVTDKGEYKQKFIKE